TRRDGSVLLLTDRHGRWPRPLAEDPGDNMDPVPSPSTAMARFVAYIHRPMDDLNRWDLRLIDITNGQTRTLFGLPKEKAWSPRWSPDGEQIIFLSRRSGWTEVWSIRPDGEGQRQLTHVGQDLGEFAISPDGSRIAFTVHREGAVDLFLAPFPEGEPRVLKE